MLSIYFYTAGICLIPAKHACKPEEISQFESKFLNRFIQTNTPLENEQASGIEQAVSQQLTATITKAINHHFIDPNKVFLCGNFKPQQFLLLELLYNPNTALDNVHSSINHIPWLSEKIIKTVNQSSFYHHKAKQSDIKVTDLKLALSFIGMENLKQLVPIFCMQHWLPVTKTRQQNLCRKFMRYFAISGLAARTMAKPLHLNEAFFFTCSLLSHLGLASIIHDSATIFDDIRQQWLAEAEQMENAEIQHAIVQTPFPNQVVHQLIHSQSDALSWQLLEKIDFNNSKLTNVIKDLAQSAYAYHAHSSNAALIARARAFGKILYLESERKISKQDRTYVIDYYQLADEEPLLRKQDYNSFNEVML